MRFIEIRTSAGRELEGQENYGTKRRGGKEVWPIQTTFATRKKNEGRQMQAEEKCEKKRHLEMEGGGTKRHRPRLALRAIENQSFHEEGPVRR